VSTGNPADHGGLPVLKAGVREPAEEVGGRCRGGVELAEQVGVLAREAVPAQAAATGAVAAQAARLASRLGAAS
jgi:hypothetical protein